LVEILAPQFDLYINDSFSVCHRDHTSMTLLAEALPHCAGRLLQKELDALSKISIKDCLYLLGGAKPEENIKLLKGKKVLAGGLFGQLCLVSKGKDLGYQNDYLKKNMLIKQGYDEFILKLKDKLNNVITPIDFAVDKNKKRVELKLEDFPNEYEIEDIGPETLKIYIDEIKKAPAIYMKGPFGFCGDKKYAKGTLEILKAVSQCKGFSLIGGGHLSEAIEMSKIPEKKFGHISLSGGALLTYVAGDKLPALVSLEK
jgi:phosphoglycerate kinase